MTENQDKVIKQLYLETYDALIAYAYGVIQSYALAEEAVQETFRIACSKPEEMISSPNPRGWLTITLKYVLQNMIRTHTRLNQFLLRLYQFRHPEENSFYDSLDVDTLYSNLSKDKDFILLKKIALEKKSVVEIAAEMNISVEACTKRIQRAKKRLEKLMQKL